MEKIETLGPSLSDSGLDAHQYRPRTIVNHLTNEDYLRICMPNLQDMTPQGFTTQVPGHNKLYEAIGYLASWNLNYPTVEIYADGGYDLIAVYLKDDGRRGYAIGAVWHEDHYGFHS